MSIARELNIDESWFLASALRYTKDIVPWRSAHNGTSGPLTPWLLTFLGYLGAPLNYFTTHTVALGLQILTVCFSYGTVRILCGEVPARFAAMPLALLFSRTGDPNYLHLASENVPNALMTAGAFTAAQAFNALKFKKTNRWWFGFAGLFLGGVGFAKLQAGPMALFISVFVVVSILTFPLSRRERSIALLFFGSGVFLVPAFILGIVFLGGAWKDMWHIYIDANLAYGNKNAEHFSFFDRLRILVSDNLVFAYLLHMLEALTAVVFTGQVLLNQSNSKAKNKRIFVASIVFLGVSLFCVAKPGFFFPHYLLLLIFPIILLFGILIQLILKGQPARTWWVLSLGAAFIVPVFSVSKCILSGEGVLEGDRLRLVLEANKEEPIKKEAQILSKLATANDQCAIWGLRTDLYVDGCPRPATREIVLDTVPGPFGDLSRQRFLDDMKKNKPRIFVDAVCFSGVPKIGWYTTGPALERGLPGYQPYPPLRDYIANRYSLKSEVPCAPGVLLQANLLGNQLGKASLEGVIRIYERRELTERVR
ncbi:MAG: hypothetical protein ACKN9V_02330 [Pseudomonadota bacterium]